MNPNPNTEYANVTGNGLNEQMENMMGELLSLDNGFDNGNGSY